VGISTALFGEGAPVGESYRRLRLEDLETRLTDVLELMVSSPSRWILIIQTAGERYVQFLASEDGALVSECVSNSYLPDASKLSADDEELLAELGGMALSPQTAELEDGRVRPRYNCRRRRPRPAHPAAVFGCRTTMNCR